MNESNIIWYPENPILITDDEEHILLTLSGILKSYGINNIITCNDTKRMLKILGSRTIELLLLDLSMPYPSGKDLLPAILEGNPQMPVIIITGNNEVSTAVDCMKHGVFDYLVKAIEERKLIATVKRAIELRELKRENLELKTHLMEGDLRHPEAIEGMVCEDERMKSIFLYLEAIAKSTQTVLITGETGVGKDVAVQAIHIFSGRVGELIAINVAGLDDTMFTDTLFGHVKGAYTGANELRTGMIGKAGSGTLFLDEIGDIDIKTQVKLLRLLESGEYYPLGSDFAKRSDARIVVATHRDLEKDVGKGVFRKDLFYRLQTHHIHIPPLRERTEDIPVFVKLFLAQAEHEYQKSITAVDPRVMSALKQYNFPGNIRELKSMIFNAVSKVTSPRLCLESFDLPNSFISAYETLVDEQAPFVLKGRFPTIREAVDYLIQEALLAAKGNQAYAAGLLGISPPALSRRLKVKK